MSVVFSDLSAAFPSIIRRLAVGTDISDLELANRLRALNFDGQMISDVLADMQRIDVWAAVGTPKQLHKLVAEMLGTT